MLPSQLFDIITDLPRLTSSKVLCSRFHAAPGLLHAETRTMRIISREDEERSGRALAEDEEGPPGVPSETRITALNLAPRSPLGGVGSANGGSEGVSSAASI